MCSRLGVVLQHGAMGCRVSVSQYTKCIVTGEAWGWRIVSLYTPLYCDKLRAGRLRIVSQYKELYCDRRVWLGKGCIAIHSSVL